VRPWLYRIAHNVSVSLARAHSPAACGLENVEALQDNTEALELRMRAHRILLDVASLPATQRQAIVSSSLQGASHDEIAHALGISAGSVRGLIYRARATLRAAAAAAVPAPVLTWIVRRLETQALPAPAVEAAAGGGGAGLAAVMVKGGIVLSIAGAAAIPGAVGGPHPEARHRHYVARAVPAPTARASTAPNAVGAVAPLSSRTVSRPAAVTAPAGPHRVSISKPTTRAPRLDRRSTSEDGRRSSGHSESGRGLTPPSGGESHAPRTGSDDGGLVTRSGGGGPGPSGGSGDGSTRDTVDGGGSGSDGSGSGGSGSGDHGGAVSATTEETSGHTDGGGSN
jgi:DNA-binding CsgD family transcriptional regulator